MDENKFSHNQSQYERPGFPYLCGRGVIWQKPCHQGPKLDGSCGGTTECAPLQIDGKWECQRPTIAGGPCKEGPSESGECAWHHSPCVPKPTLRVYRSHLILLSFGTIVALIAVSWIFNKIEYSFFGTNPGPLTSAHIKFTENQGCFSCHVSHGKKSVGWLTALFTQTDVSSKCVGCHTFGGPASKAHNGDIRKYNRLQDTSCWMCHREHKGDKLATLPMEGKQCNFCHQKQFLGFSKGHPEFPADYPHSRRDSINFDHISHLNKHFANQKFADKAPKACMGCHTVTLEKEIVTPERYEVVCAQCHDHQISKKDLVLLRLPEMDKNRIDRKAILKACEILEPKVKKPSGDFLSVSTEPVNFVSAYLLNIPLDDPEGYSKRLQDLIMLSARDDLAPLANLIDQHLPTPMADKLLAGLSPEMFKRAACSWGLNIEYQSPAEEGFGGWFADLLEIRYTPTRHADPVAIRWLEFALSVTEIEEEEGGPKFERAKAMRDHLISPKTGIGVCAKCHAVTATNNKKGKKSLKFEWGYKGPRNKPYNNFSHKNHLDILVTGNSCKKCHIFDIEADYNSSFENENFDPKKFFSNFEPIRLNICRECHAQGQVREDCQLCHIYHFKPRFKKGMLKDQNNR